MIQHSKAGVSGLLYKRHFGATEISATTYILQSSVNGQHVESISSSFMYWYVFLIVCLRGGK